MSKLDKLKDRLRQTYDLQVHHRTGQGSWFVFRRCIEADRAVQKAAYFNTERLFDESSENYQRLEQEILECLGL